MKNQALKIGLGLALGAYIYEVINNLLAHQPISDALINIRLEASNIYGCFRSDGF